MTKVIAVDLGASNGRLILANYENETIQLEEIYRFSNSPIEKEGSLYWDIEHIFNEIKSGFKKYTIHNHSLQGIGIDTWGVDFGLVSKDNIILENPYSYRDTHTIAYMPIVHDKMAIRELYNRTGVESAPINTLYQLYTIFQKRADLEKKTNTILTLPSLLHFMLTGKKYNEYTHASTTQLLHSESQNWDQNMIKQIFGKELPLGEIKQTNAIIGYTLDTWNKEMGMEPVPVINVPGHDTACALAAMPKESKNTAFISCGTWVLIGVEVDQAVTSDIAFESGFTNEGTAVNTYRLQKNNMGLWLLQQCKKEWEFRDEEVSYKDEELLIKDTEQFKALIDPDNDMFFNPDSMLDAIQLFCKETKQPIPESKGEYIRCILESLALKYRWVIEKLELITGRTIPSIHMAGGGIRKELLCQFIANATGKKLKAGPIEASAIGNVLSQFIALGTFEHYEEALEIAGKSFGIKEYSPQDGSKWDEAYHAFLTYLAK